ncbi:MAG: HD domain-containing protein [Syntrophomonadaceae bacterium]|jgi:metal-dependent HD superfamily phosphatase/phosphodiesterase
MITVKDIKANPLINTFIEKGNQHLGVMGYTDHGYYHLNLVSEVSRKIIEKLGYSERMAELAAIAGYMHDIGNVINRHVHSQGGALIAMEILRRMNADPAEIAIICSSIGNHDEINGQPVNEVAAALILADKSHVHRDRVRNTDFATFDIHDRVNYAAEHSILEINAQQKSIIMDLKINTCICPVMDYFEIFLSRMLMCRRAANFLGCEFELVINGAKLL